MGELALAVPRPVSPLIAKQGVGCAEVPLLVRPPVDGVVGEVEIEIAIVVQVGKDSPITSTTAAQGLLLIELELTLEAVSWGMGVVMSTCNRQSRKTDKWRGR